MRNRTMLAFTLLALLGTAPLGRLPHHRRRRRGHLADRQGHRAAAPDQEAAATPLAHAAAGVASTRARLTAGPPSARSAHPFSTKSRSTSGLKARPWPGRSGAMMCPSS